MHLGSLYTALASYLDARSNFGRWLVRIDDIDTPRNVAGATDDILRTLEAFGLHWDGSVYYQSRQLGHYQARLDSLAKKSLLYPCTCSRKTLAIAVRTKSHPEDYPGICKHKTFPQTKPFATRIRVADRAIAFYDALRGNQSDNLAASHGDFIVKRKDQIFAYQFTVAIDDHSQNVTHVVRGADLLDSTFKQIYLQQELEFSRPNYMHVPLITDRHGNKLSKQTFAQEVDKSRPRHVLFKLLELLWQSPPSELADCSLHDILDWGIAHWKPALLKNIDTICPDKESF